MSDTPFFDAAMERQRKQALAIRARKQRAQEQEAEISASQENTKAPKPEKARTSPVRGFKGGDPVAIGKLGGRPKGKKNSDPAENLSERERKYLANRCAGMTKGKAAREAGYSKHMAAHASTKIETAGVREAFRRMLLHKVPLAKAVNRISEGMDAVDTQFFTKDGKVTDSRDVINWGERRKATNLYAQMTGAYVPRQELQTTQKIDEATIRKFNEISEKLGVANLPIEQLRELAKSHVPFIEAEIIPDSTEAETDSNK